MEPIRRSRLQPGFCFKAYIRVFERWTCTSFDPRFLLLSSTILRSQWNIVFFTPFQACGAPHNLLTPLFLLFLSYIIYWALRPIYATCYIVDEKGSPHKVTKFKRKTISYLQQMSSSERKYWALSFLENMAFRKRQ